MAIPSCIGDHGRFLLTWLGSLAFFFSRRLIYLSYLFSMCVPYEGYSINTLYVLNYIFTFLLLYFTIFIYSVILKQFNACNNTLHCLSCSEQNKLEAIYLLTVGTRECDKLTMTGQTKSSVIFISYTEDR